MADVVVSGSFDDLRSRHIRFLEEAARRGNLRVQLWSDELFQLKEGRTPKFPDAERLYFVRAIRYVQSAEIVSQLSDPTALPVDLSDPVLKRFPKSASDEISSTDRKKVLVTGCFDWLHTGHVRFFEEVSEYGDVYAVVGHDANIELLKGKGHPLFPQDERRYVVGATRYVKQALISTGRGWMDAAPEIERIKPDIYAVNEDGDNPEKRAFCRDHGLQYLVLKRLPKPGLTARSSTELRSRKGDIQDFRCRG
jgi:cytidyltransferase-like protein